MPRPGKNTIFYTGVLAGHAKDRDAIVPRKTATTTRREDATWRELSKHGIGVDTLACPCGGRMTFREIILPSTKEKKTTLRGLLRALGHRDELLPMARARAPPQTDLDFDA